MLRMNMAEAEKLIGGRFGFVATDANEVVRKLKLPGNSKILDVGTGMGYMAITLALNGYEVLTGEPSTDGSIYAKKDWVANAKKVNVDHLIKFQPLDARDMPFESDFFDAIFCLGTFHHIDKPARPNVLKEFIRVTKSKAVICFLEPNQQTIHEIREIDPSHPDAADPTDYLLDINGPFRKLEGVHFDAYVIQKQ